MIEQISDGKQGTILGVDPIDKKIKVAWTDSKGISDFLPIISFRISDEKETYTNTDISKLLEELDLKDNYFSVRGELVFVNTQNKEIVIKICPAIKSKNLKNKNFKLVIKGEISLEFLKSFVSLELSLPAPPE